MEKNSSLIRTIIFNILLILTLVFIYLLFFPKKSYVKTKLENKISPKVEETYNTNINNMKIASDAYFENNNVNKVTLEELVSNNLITQLKDSNDEFCSLNSYVEQDDEKTTIRLICPDNEGTVEIPKNKENNCVYEYKKEISEGYTEWSDWSEWSLEKKESNDLTNVETKTEKEEDGTEIVNDSNQINIDAYWNQTSACPDGYYEEGDRCKRKEMKNSISASVKYTCPDGYRRSGTNCYNGNRSTTAKKIYYCPSDQSNIEFVLDGSSCQTYAITYTNKNASNGYYSCPDGYNLSGSTCYKYETSTHEQTKYKETTYYRYQTREKTASKIDVIWSYKDNQELLDKEYNMSEEPKCDF